MGFWGFGVLGFRFSFSLQAFGGGFAGAFSGQLLEATALVVEGAKASRKCRFIYRVCGLGSVLAYKLLAVALRGLFLDSFWELPPSLLRLQRLPGNAALYTEFVV